MAVTPSALDQLAKSRPAVLYSMMPFGRRLGAILADLLILQLTIVAGGFVCPMAGQPMTHDGTAAMSGMLMPGMPGMTPRTPAPRGTPPEGPCKLPWAPAGCCAMTPCMPAFVVPSVPAFVPPDVPLVSTPALIMLRPASITRRPELPPPRA